MSSSNTNKSPSTTTPTTETPPSTVSPQPSLPHFLPPRCRIRRPEVFLNQELGILAPPMSPPRTPEPKSPEPTNYVNRVFIEPTVICWTGVAHPKAPVHNTTHLLHSSVDRKDSLCIRSTGVPVKIQSGIPGSTPVPLNFAVMGKPVVQRAAPTIGKE